MSIIGRKFGKCQKRNRQFLEHNRFNPTLGYANELELASELQLSRSPVVDFTVYYSIALRLVSHKHLILFSGWVKYTVTILNI